MEGLAVGACDQLPFHSFSAAIVVYQHDSGEFLFLFFIGWVGKYAFSEVVRMSNKVDACKNHTERTWLKVGRKQAPSYYLLTSLSSFLPSLPPSLLPDRLQRLPVHVGLPHWYVWVEGREGGREGTK